MLQINIFILSPNTLTPIASMTCKKKKKIIGMKNYDTIRICTKLKYHVCVLAVRKIWRFHHDLKYSYRHLRGINVKNYIRHLHSIHRTLCIYSLAARSTKSRSCKYVEVANMSFHPKIYSRIRAQLILVLV